jgi:cation transport ATPase
MNLKKINKKAFISSVTFIIILVKDILVSGLQVIPERGLTNRLISWFFIIPIMIIGTVLSIQVIREKYLQIKSKPFFDINLLLAIPTLLCFLYIFGKMIHVFTL